MKITQTSENMTRCAYEIAGGCRWKNPRFSLHACDGYDKCRYFAKHVSEATNE